MSSDDSRAVWILGAGFSKSLGGPLLNDLFTPRLAERIRHAAGDEEVDAVRETTHRTNRTLTGLYGLHDRHVEAAKTPWSDPESFVAYVCAAAEAERLGRNEQRVRHMQAMLKGTDLTLAQAERACRNYLALACWEFCAHRDDAGEDWIPYRRWAERVRESDTVASFNYDEVCERSGAPYRRDWLANPEPEAPSLDERQGPLFLKLHGSWRWRLSPKNADGTHPARSVDNEAGHERIVQAFANPTDDDLAYEAAIGVPGPGKVSLADGPLGSLWNAMDERLRIADSVVFVGYSMPKSDNAAKKRILEAIRDNTSDCLSIHIVLGPPDVGGSSITRLVGMLEWALSDRSMIHRTPSEAQRSIRDVSNVSGYRRAMVQVHHLFAEDFLTVYDPSRLSAYRKHA